LLPFILLDQETDYLSFAMIGREGEVLYGIRVPIEGAWDNPLTWKIVADKLVARLRVPWSGNVVQVKQQELVVRVEPQQIQRVVVGQEVAIYQAGSVQTQKSSRSVPQVGGRIMAILEDRHVAVSVPSTRIQASRVVGAKVEYIPHLAGDKRVLGGTLILGHGKFDETHTLHGMFERGKRAERSTVGHFWAQIETYPVGAKLFLDGRYLGKSPFEGEVFAKFGQVKLDVVSPPGYQDISTLVDVGEDEHLYLAGKDKLRIPRRRLPAVKNFLQAAQYAQADAVLADILKEPRSLELPQALFLHAKLCLLSPQHALKECVERLRNAYEYYEIRDALMLPSVELAYAFSLIASRLSHLTTSKQSLAWAIKTVKRWAHSLPEGSQLEHASEYIQRFAELVELWGDTPDSHSVLEKIYLFLQQQNLELDERVRDSAALTVNEKITLTLHKSMLSLWGGSGDLQVSQGVRF
ncbi:MAG: PEGA domain-containing protein, partial [Zetaproteobacteria bacterium]|nr:PEGA domain-containing protein [Zetaproteobacteria bacterium]